MKRTVSASLILCLAAGLLLFLSACGAGTPPDEALSPLVSEAILSDNAGVYFDGECAGEGHKLLGCRVSGSTLKVYALTTYGNYGFRNGAFIKVSGSGVIPAVLTFEKNGEEYKPVGIEYPRDGAGYTKSIKRMFPARYRRAALHADAAYDALQAQERSYAEAYLDRIGREAQIGEWKDLDIRLLTDAGVSAEVSDRLSCDKELGAYPFWLGTAEYLENGVRFVRSTAYDAEAGQIIFQTCEKEGGAVTERFVFDARMGVRLFAFPEEETASIETLKKSYPEYFALDGSRGIEVYVWQMAERAYRCGILPGTERCKTEEEIWGLQERSLSVDEAKAILRELGVAGSDVAVIPTAQPYSGYLYEIDEEYAGRVSELFCDD